MIHRLSSTVICTALITMALSGCSSSSLKNSFKQNDTEQDKTSVIFLSTVSSNLVDNSKKDKDSFNADTLACNTEIDTNSKKIGSVNSNWNGIPEIPAASSKTQTNEYNVMCLAKDVNGHTASFWSQSKTCNNWLANAKKNFEAGPTRYIAYSTCTSINKTIGKKNQITKTTSARTIYKKLIGFNKDNNP